jgi:hypothetical protein
MAINFTVEIIVFFIASILMIFSSALLFKKYSQVKERIYLYLSLSWLSCFLYYFFAIISFIFLSEVIYQIHFLILIPTTLFLIYSIDFMSRLSVDPKKIIIFTLASTGMIWSLFPPNQIEQYTLITGGFSFKTEGSLFLWLNILLAQPLILFFSYCLKIYIITPKKRKKYALINLLGGIFFGFFSLVTLALGLGKRIPGIVVLPLSIGALISSIALYRSSELLTAIRRTKQIAKMKLLWKTIPICANCKNIRDLEGKWHPIENFLKEMEIIEFTHSICENCANKLYPDYK